MEAKVVAYNSYALSVGGAQSIPYWITVISTVRGQDPQKQPNSNEAGV